MCLLCMESWHIEHPDAIRSRRECFIDTMIKRRAHAGVSKAQAGDEGNKSSHSNPGGRQLIFSDHGFILDPLACSDDMRWLYHEYRRRIVREVRRRERQNAHKPSLPVSRKVGGGAQASEGNECALEGGLGHSTLKHFS